MTSRSKRQTVLQALCVIAAVAYMIIGRDNQAVTFLAASFVIWALAE